MFIGSVILTFHVLFFLIDVEFAFAEDDFRALEPDNINGDPTTLPVLVTKSTQIATRVELKVIPYTVEEAIRQNVPLPRNIPAPDSRSSPFAGKKKSLGVYNEDVVVTPHACVEVK